MRSRFSCILMLFVACMCVEVSAQDAVSRNHYGKGVQAYHRGNNSTARQHLEQALNHGSQDPRVYYFLGLTKLRSGDRYGAESDFNAAATLEYSGKRKYDVGMALSRIQGGERLQLEKIRRMTKAVIRSMPKSDKKPDAAAPMPPPSDSGSSDSGSSDSGNYDEFDQAPIRKSMEALPGDTPQDDSTDGSLEEDQNPGFEDVDVIGAGDMDSGGVVSSVMRALFNAGGKALPKPRFGVSFPGPMPAAGGDVFGAEAESFGEPDAGMESDAGDLGDIFGDDDPAMNEGDAETDPFADDPLEDGAGDGLDADDPFGEDPSLSDPLSDDPFADDPFADEAADMPADEDDPFGGDDDPFGEESDSGDDDPFGL